MILTLLPRTSTGKHLTHLKNTEVKALKLDFSNTGELKKAIAPFDLVVGAVPGFMGFQTAKAVIESGKNMVDISFFPEDPFLLDELARKNNVTVVTDCGVAEWGTSSWGTTTSA